VKWREMARDKHAGFSNNVDKENGYGDGNDVAVL
jgi:hypothetical protein